MAEEKTAKPARYLKDPLWYYDPKHYEQPFADDGVRGRIIDGKQISAEIRTGIKANIYVWSSSG